MHDLKDIDSITSESEWIRVSNTFSKESCHCYWEREKNQLYCRGIWSIWPPKLHHTTRKIKTRSSWRCRNQHMWSKGTLKVPNYRRYLTSSGNKGMLSAFVCNYITSSGPRRLPEEQTIILARGFEDAEETNTRIKLHAIHLAETYTRVIVKCNDTDVLVLLSYQASCSVFGSGLIQMCVMRWQADPTSSFFKIGKTTAFTKLQKHLEELKGRSHYGLRTHLEESSPVANVKRSFCTARRRTRRVSVYQSG